MILKPACTFAPFYAWRLNTVKQKWPKGGLVEERAFALRTGLWNLPSMPLHEQIAKAALRGVIHCPFVLATIAFISSVFFISSRMAYRNPRNRNPLFELE
jgi:hypothetical protein